VRGYKHFKALYYIVERRVNDIGVQYFPLQTKSGYGAHALNINSYP